MRAKIITAYNESFAEIGDLCADSIERYQKLHPDIEIAVLPIARDYEREPSWFKVRAILRALQDTDCVLWIDADAMIVGTEDFRPQITNATLNICRDENGINCGVMAWQNCTEARESLERMEASYRVHPWFEQSALMEFVDTINVHYLPKRMFNAYPGERTPETLICHWPGMPQADRLLAMKSAL